MALWKGWESTAGSTGSDDGNGRASYGSRAVVASFPARLGQQPRGRLAGDM
jgi:hypothetical protein